LTEVISKLEIRTQVLVHRLRANVGLARALNAGLALVSTQWVVRADADDINLTDRLECQAAYAHTHPEVDVFGGYICEYTADGVMLGCRKVPLESTIIRLWSKRRNPFNHMTVAFRADIVRDHGGYPDIYLREDYGLWAKLLGTGAVFANIDKVLVHATTGIEMYRRRGGLRYAKGEVGLQKHLVHCGLKSRTSALVDGLLRVMIFILPAALRAQIYERMLRHRSL